MDHLSLSLGLDPDPTSPAKVRRAATARFGHLLSAPVLADLMLLTTELVTNAVAHGTGPVDVRLTLTDLEVKAEVIDQGEGFEHEIREFGVDAATGRGLAIVSSVASSWGVYEGSSHVWFVLDRGGPTPGAEDPVLGTPPSGSLPAD